jgi:hypothetical protein
MASTDFWNFSAYFVFPTLNVWLSKPSTFEVYSILMGPDLLVGLWVFFPSTIHAGLVPMSGSGIFFFFELSCLRLWLTH